MYWLLEMTSARPRATCKPASVTMNGSSRKRVEMTPCAAPNAAPQATTNSRVGMRLQPLVMIVAVSTLERLSSAPTERSMPAVMMTKVMPTAMMPVSDTARTMLAILSGCRNRIMPCRRGEKITPPIATTIRPMTLWKRTATANGSRRALRRRRDRFANGLRHLSAPSPQARAVFTPPRCRSPPPPRALHVPSRPGRTPPRVRPPRRTTTRSHRPRSSGISLDATSTPSPCFARSRMRA